MSETLGRRRHSSVMDCIDGIVVLHFAAVTRDSEDASDSISNTVGSLYVLVMRQASSYGFSPVDISV
jgi:hypothetical protein